MIRHDTLDLSLVFAENSFVFVSREANRHADTLANMLWISGDPFSLNENQVFALKKKVTLKKIKVLMAITKKLLNVCQRFKNLIVRELYIYMVNLFVSFKKKSIYFSFARVYGKYIRTIQISWYYKKKDKLKSACN